MEMKVGLLVVLMCLLVVKGDDAPQQSISGIPYNKGGSLDGFSRRIEFEMVTVDDMALALQWYVDVIGGVKLEFCNEDEPTEGCSEEGVTYYGDQHKLAMFGPELVDGENRYVPDIGTNGEYQVLSNFVAFGNGVVQLIKYEQRQTKEVYLLREPLTSPCWVGGGHICFWQVDDMDMNDYIYIAQKEAALRNLSNIQWNRPVPQENRKDRDNVPVDEYSNKITDGSAFDGLSWSYYKGPIAEQLEMYKMAGTIRDGVGASYCDRGAVSLAYVNHTHPSRGNSDIRGGLYGIFQFGFRTSNLHAAVGFYTEVMGGNLIPYPTEGLDIRGDENHWMLLANETITSYEYSNQAKIPRDEAMRRLGVLNISTTGGGRLDHRFILFDNFVVEPLLYTDGLTFGGTPFNPTWDHNPSPAYIGTVGAAFGIPDNAPTIQDALITIKKRADARGFKNHPVFIPQTPTGFDIGHPYSGLEYAYGRGQSGEVLNFVNIQGNFRAVLKQTLEQNGFVSTMFDSTNVYLNGDMNEFCSSLSK